MREIVMYPVRRLLRYTGGHGLGWVLPLRRFAAAVPVVAKVDGYRMLLELREIYNWNLFFRETRSIEEFGAFCRSIRPGMTVVDVGANIGIFTLAAAKLVGPSGRVFAFEPVLRNFQLLNGNVVLNKYTNVVCELGAVSDQDGTLEMNSMGNDNMTISADTGTSNTQVMTVPTTRLDTYLARHGVSHIDVIKIDVEGAESRVLEGMRGLFAGPNPPTVVMEVHPDFLMADGKNAVDVLEVLDGHGYEMFHIHAPGPAGVFEEIPIRDVRQFTPPYTPSMVPYNRFRIFARPAGGRPTAT